MRPSFFFIPTGRFHSQLAAKPFCRMVMSLVQSEWRWSQLSEYLAASALVLKTISINKFHHVE